MSQNLLNIRNCYCTLWEKNPETLEKQGLPRGFCGFCSMCGKPGHLRQAPGASPSTDSWCDPCFKKAEFYDRLRLVTLVGIFIPIFWRLWYVSGIMLGLFIALTWIMVFKPKEVIRKLNKLSAE